MHQTNPDNQPPAGDTTFTTSLSGSKRSFLPGDIVDGTYQLTALLGQGGMGLVFACRHIIMGKDYAIKILSGEDLSEEAWLRFRSEAQALANLNHPNIVAVHNMGVDEGKYPYYVMDLIAGVTLDRLILKKHRPPINEVLTIFIAVAEALKSSHARGIIHRDVKPSNIMIERDSSDKIKSVKLVDFGIARLSTKGYQAQSQTKTGLIFGTPYYMSPEQCQGLRVDERSDIYSLGCALFESLTGRTPFCGENAFHTFMLHQTEPAPALVDADPSTRYPDALEAAVAKMLAKKLTARYQTMTQIERDLTRIKEGKPIMANEASGLGEIRSTYSPRYSSYTSGTTSNGAQTDGQRSFSFRNKMITASALIGALLTAAIYCAYTINHPLGETGKVVEQDVSLEKDLMFDQRYSYFCDHQDEVERLLEAYRKDPKTAQAPFKTERGQVGFNFPPAFIIGQIKVADQAKAGYACGFVPVPPDSRVCMYLTAFTRFWPDILDKFGPSDLTGLEIVTKKPAVIVNKVKSWGRLDELSFFNSLIKALPGKNNETRYDESVIHKADIASINTLTNLKSIGLCGPALNGEDVTNMQLLNTIGTLKIKRISNIKPLLDCLPKHKNIKELWLLREDIKDADLEPLIAMENLETLRIRSSNLTAASLLYFKKMKSLKHLYITQEWLPSEAEQFKREIPFCIYESPTDLTYWRLFPNQPSE